MQTTLRDGGAPRSVEEAVRQRYSEGASEPQPKLCCPVEYDAKLLEVIPREILEKDYGCGDPSKYLSEGETVLDLGSGGGKICYIASQVVGPEGSVIGVDFNDDMLALARKYRAEVGSRIGHQNVQFRKGKIQDLQLDLDLFEHYLQEHTISGATDYMKAQEHADWIRRNEPLVEDESVDVIVSNCVLNLVKPEDKALLFNEMYRTLRRGGRCVISDIVSDEDVPDKLKRDPELWSGCISGAFREDAFLEAFEKAGFYGIEIAARQEEPWAVVEGIEFRSVTVIAYKGKEGPCIERNQAVIYKGPWRSVTDDDGHTLVRGRPMAVCDKTFHIYSRPPYSEEIIPVPPHEEVPADEARPFDCKRDRPRHARETKGRDYDVTIEPDSSDCSGPDCC